jgi:prefoldin subunit 5
MIKRVKKYLKIKLLEIAITFLEKKIDYLEEQKAKLEGKLDDKSNKLLEVMNDET